MKRKKKDANSESKFGENRTEGKKILPKKEKSQPQDLMLLSMNHC